MGTRSRTRVHISPPLLEVGTGFHPELTGRENVYLNGAILGMTREEIRSRFDDIVAFSEISRFLDTPVKHYSSGMYVRLAFAVSAHLDPEILLVDEVLSVGDAAFQRKCVDRIRSVAREGRTVLFVSHNMSAVRNLCDEAIWLDDGVVRERGPVAEVVDAYLAGTVRSETLDDVQHLLQLLPEDPSLRVDHVDVQQGGRSTTVVGNGQTVRLIADFVVKRFPGANFVGRGWPDAYLPWDELWSTYRRTQIGWNIHNSIGPVNFRTYELPAFGVMQICDNRERLGDLYRLGEEVVGFETIDECVEKTRYYLEHVDEQRDIAAAGRARWERDYTPDAVWDRLVRIVDEHVKHHEGASTASRSTAEVLARRRRQAVVWSIVNRVAAFVRRLRYLVSAAWSRSRRQGPRRSSGG